MLRAMRGRSILAVVASAWIVLACQALAPPPSALPDPVVDCLAAPPAVCRTALGDAQANAPDGEWAVRVRVTCSQPVCTENAGVAQVDVLFSDGSIDSYATEWSAAVEAPAGADPADIQAVTPTCIGLDITRCREMAKSIIRPVGQTGRIESIVVACTVPACTPSEGQGTTTVTFEDGMTREADWAYAGG